MSIKTYPIRGIIYFAFEDNKILPFQVVSELVNEISSCHLNLRIIDIVAPVPEHLQDSSPNPEQPSDHLIG